MVLGTIPLARLPEAEAVPVIEHAIHKGINFIDTARAYGDAERYTGIAINNFKDHKIAIATKSMERSGEKLREDLEKSLSILKRDSVNYFFLHQVDSFPDLDSCTDKKGALEAALKAKKEGLIKNLGLSGHFTPVLKEAVENLPLDILLGRFNLTMGIDEYNVIDMAVKKGITVGAMKIFEGGFITKHTDLCIRNAALNNNIDHILLGCETKEQINKNLTVFNHPEPLTTDELTLLAEKAQQLYENSFCAQCGYCTASCPKDIPISHVFNLTGKLTVYGNEYGFKGSPGAELYLSQMMEAIDLCDDCGKCEEHCPNRLKIRKQLKKEKEKFSSYSNPTKDNNN